MMDKLTQTQFKNHYYRIGRVDAFNDDSEPIAPNVVSFHRQKIEPWLSAVFQSEHLSLLLGSGFPTSISHAAGVSGLPSMDRVEFGTKYDKKITSHAERLAERAHRGTANIEDEIRSAMALADGCAVAGKAEDERELRAAIRNVLRTLVDDILASETALRTKIEAQDEQGLLANSLLCSFLLSFASRTATRERLHIFTTNYDRFIEYGCDWIGLRLVDRFVGHLSPIYRSSRMDVDMHYNPPGIRGEPRYLEGVVKLTKLHGSLDWRYEQTIVRRIGIAFGAELKLTSTAGEECVLIYPNPAKDIETTEYPYADLFRDYAAALCRPNSALVTYGYGFGDDHINRVIRDMLTVPSTHLVVIAWDDPGRNAETGAVGRIERFCREVGRDAQMSILLGKHFGDLNNLVSHYLPKPAIDQISGREARLKERRGEWHVTPPADGTGASTIDNPKPESDL
jgi:hypothetical protein